MGAGSGRLGLNVFCGCRKYLTVCNLEYSITPLPMPLNQNSVAMGQGIGIRGLFELHGVSATTLAVDFCSVVPPIARAHSSRTELVSPSQRKGLLSCAMTRRSPWRICDRTTAIHRWPITRSRFSTRLSRRSEFTGRFVSASAVPFHFSFAPTSDNGGASGRIARMCDQPSALLRHIAPTDLLDAH